MVRVGLVRRPLGLRGEVLVEALTDREDRFRPGVELRAGERPVVVERTRSVPSGLALKLRDVDDAEAAASLRGRYLEVPLGEVERLPEGHFYHWQLIGLRVYDAAGVLVGELVDVLEYPANDAYVVRGEGGELLLPAVAQVVREVDLERGRMVVDLPAEEVVR